MTLTVSFVERWIIKMKNIILINGSARKNGNTAQMLEKVKNGANSVGASVEIINLFDLDYKGCSACYACKINKGKYYGHCSIEDDLKPLFHKIENADAFVLGSPIYWSNLSGQMRSFMERFFFQYLVYGEQYSSNAPKSYKTALLTTMNINEKLYKPSGLADTLDHIQMIMTLLFGSCEVLNLYETVQFDDYSKYVYSMPDREEKSSRNPKISGNDFQNAYELGVRLTN